MTDHELLELLKQRDIIYPRIRHAKTGHDYIVHGLCNMHLPDGRWITGVIYCHSKAVRGTPFVRPLSQFENFTYVPDEDEQNA